LNGLLGLRLDLHLGFGLERRLVELRGRVDLRFLLDLRFGGFERDLVDRRRFFLVGECLAESLFHILDGLVERGDLFLLLVIALDLELDLLDLLENRSRLCYLGGLGRESLQPSSAGA